MAPSTTLFTNDRHDEQAKHGNQGCMPVVWDAGFMAPCAYIMHYGKEYLVTGGAGASIKDDKKCGATGEELVVRVK